VGVKNHKFLSYILLSWAATAHASTENALHQDPVASVLLGLLVFFVAAKLGSMLAQKLRQPVVLGELLAGIVIGNLSSFGFGGFDFISHDSIYGIMASIGVILLLFEVGLESSLHDLMRVGGIALLVAVIGVVVPSLLGLMVSHVLLPDSSFYTHLFIGATLCATSVGITARVLKDLKKTQTREAKIILGAAVIDDVLGLIVLAVISGLITSLGQNEGGGVSFVNILLVTSKAIGFLVLALVLGSKLAPILFKAVSRLEIEGSLLSLSLILCFFLAYVSNLVGLAPIVGAFAAGLIIDSSGFSKFFPKEKNPVEDLIHPLSKFFVPIFFVHMGMQVKGEHFVDPKVLILGLSLAFVGILGKQACGLGVFTKEKTNRWAIGIGMIPRGEVGLIFAMMGTQLSLNGQPVLSSQTYSAIIIMVILTTLITPPLLKWSLER
jgi:Kef-type K+ transport system membrane component KefB